MKLQRWQYRHRVFKLGFCGVLFSLALMCIGYVAPAWQNTGGLWIYTKTGHLLPVWLQAVRGVESLCVVLVVVSVVVEVCQDIVPRTPPVSEWPLVEVLAVLAGVTGLVGVTVFGVEVTSYPSGQGPYGPVSKPLFWAWGLHAVACVVVVLSAVAMGYSRASKRVRSERKMQVVAFRRSAPVGVNPYFVTRCVPAVRMVPLGPYIADSQA